MKILVACEYSGRVRDAFLLKGHDAMSCDILPTETPGPHYQGDVLDILYQGWDMIIAHPPCTYLCRAGIGWLSNDSKTMTTQERLKQVSLARHLFLSLYHAPCSRICIENPIPHKKADLPRHSQIIEPWYFGEGERKKTCLWLKGLPKLQGLAEVAANPARYLPEPKYIDKSGKKRYFVDSMPATKDRQKERSKTFQSIANAMANQWG